MEKGVLTRPSREETTPLLEKVSATTSDVMSNECHGRSFRDHYTEDQGNMQPRSVELIWWLPLHKPSDQRVTMLETDKEHQTF
eukprot:372328-Amphidinium_carterae.2